MLDVKLKQKKKKLWYPLNEISVSPDLFSVHEIYWSKITAIIIKNEFTKGSHRYKSLFGHLSP